MDVRRPPAPRWWLLAVAASFAALVGSGCTSADEAERVGAGPATTAPPPAKVADWIHEDPKELRAKAIGKLPAICDLVPRPLLEQLLGGEPNGSTASTQDGKSCVWRPVEAAEDPAIDGADAIVVLQLRYPPVGQTMDEFWAEGKRASTGSAEVDGCDEAFWVDGLLNARVGDFYVAGTTALADPTPAARADSETLVSDTCTRL